MGSNRTQEGRRGRATRQARSSPKSCCPALPTTTPATPSTCEPQVLSHRTAPATSDPPYSPICRSSRVIVTNLPPSTTLDSFRTHLHSSPSSSTSTTSSLAITDVKVYSKRRFAFVGYKTPGDAAKAAAWWNGTWFAGARIKCDLVDEVSSTYPGLPSPVQSRDAPSADPSYSSYHLVPSLNRLRSTSLVALTCRTTTRSSELPRRPRPPPSRPRTRVPRPPSGSSPNRRPSRLSTSSTWRP